MPLFRVERATFTLSLSDGKHNDHRRAPVKRGHAGFTIVEVLAAIIIFGVGVLATAGSAAMVTRMIGEGKQATRMAAIAARRLAALRLAAFSTIPPCTGPRFTSGGPITSTGITETWFVPAAGNVRAVSVALSRPSVRGSRSTVLRARITC
jgi:prepilin-type N-terminal cleavage/methylation domain-containing protein